MYQSLGVFILLSGISNVFEMYACVESVSIMLQSSWQRKQSSAVLRLMQRFYRTAVVMTRAPVSLA